MPPVRGRLQDWFAEADLSQRATDKAAFSENRQATQIPGTATF